MKRLIQYLTLAAIVAAGVTQIQADQTNLVQDISIQLLGVKQGRTTTNGSFVTTSTEVVVVETRQVINALGVASGNTFSNTARLVLVSPVDGGTPGMEIRDGNKVWDVTDFFTYEQTSGELHTSLVNRFTNRGSGADIAIQRFALKNGNVALTLHFDLRGITTSTNRRIGPISLYDTTIDASGAGDRNGNLLILSGVVRIRGNTLEVVPDSGGGGVS